MNTINCECTSPKSFCSNKADTSPPPSSPLPNMFRFKTDFVLNTSPITKKSQKTKSHLVYDMLGILLQFRSSYWVVREKRSECKRICLHAKAKLKLQSFHYVIFRCPMYHIFWNTGFCSQIR